MKNILIATDFSDAANNAALFGVDLAYYLNVNVILLSVCQPVNMPVSEVPVIITLEEIQTQVERQLADEARILSARNNTPVIISCKTGTVSQAIIEAVSEHQAGMVITGMKKEGKLMRRIVGSTVTELIRKIQVPMIIVPEEARFSYLYRIALAIESDLAPDADKHILDALREIGERFHSKLYLLKVARNKFEEAYEVLNKPFQLTRIMRTLDPVFECVEGKDISQALTNFINAYQIDLLAMLPHKHPLFERLFVKSNTRAIALDTKVPLLILPEKRIPVNLHT
jgi:nucleotide-binding universal stress UspA family protein